jgi:hypothetical protein
MSDETTNYGNNIGPMAQNLVAQLHRKEGPLVFTSDNGMVHDLRVFATGITLEEIKERKSSLKSPFTGRPQLILELLPAYKELVAGRRAGRGDAYQDAMRVWWRILDQCDAIYVDENGTPLVPVNGAADLTEFHYQHYRQNPHSHSRQQQWVRLVDAARRQLGVRDLFWTVIQVPQQEEKALVSSQDVRRIYEYLKREVTSSDKGLARWESNQAAIPIRDEMINLATLFLLNTGWNSAVVLALDVSTDFQGKIACLEPHKSSPHHVYIHSIKTRSGGTRQTIQSRTGKRLTPAGILDAVLKQTEPLRIILRSHLRASNKMSFSKCANK